jgi:hypothetical protein
MHVLGDRCTLVFLAGVSHQHQPGGGYARRALATPRHAADSEGHHSGPACRLMRAPCLSDALGEIDDFAGADRATDDQASGVADTLMPGRNSLSLPSGIARMSTELACQIAGQRRTRQHQAPSQACRQSSAGRDRRAGHRQPQLAAMYPGRRSRPCRRPTRLSGRAAGALACLGLLRSFLARLWAIGGRSPSSVQPAARAA